MGELIIGFLSLAACVGFPVFLYCAMLNALINPPPLPPPEPFVPPAGSVPYFDVDGGMIWWIVIND